MRQTRPSPNKLTVPTQYYEVIRVVLVAHLHGNAPQVAVETGHKAVPSGKMPSSQELEQALQELQIA